MSRRLREIGPAAMVAAAFIGPGTVTTATLSGATFGYTLLWAILFSIIATICLQDMAARVGLIGRMGLGNAIRSKINNRVIRILASVLVIAAIVLGNAAYEAGNITGAVLGFNQFNVGTENWQINLLIPVLGVVAFLILYVGKYNLIEKTLVCLVGLMSVVFLITALLVKPDFQAILSGLFIPSLPDNSLIFAVGLIGTTVVPYNLFLHASSVKQKWKDPSYLDVSRLDTIISVVVGGLITLAIMVTSAAVLNKSGIEISNANDLALQLQPLLGDWSHVFLAFGFLAAGLSSAITAPLAAAYATAGISGWEEDLKSRKFQFIWFVVLLTGIVFSILGFKPISVILFAQVANGILLPVIVVFLLWVMNDRNILGKYVNSITMNVFGILIVIVALILGLKSIASVIGVL